MTPQVLLDAFHRLIREEPALAGRGAYEAPQHEWLGRASHLIQEWDSTEAIGFKVAARAMAGNLNRQMNYGSVLTTIREAIASLEAGLPSGAAQIFGPGAVYDVFKALNDLVGSATKSLLIIDPYMDGSIFDTYLSNLQPSVATRLLIARYVENVKAAASTFHAQRGNTVEVRRSLELHDRVIFVDSAQCWVLGASIKDAAAKKPTYLAPLSDDVVGMKLCIYESLWDSAVKI
jgi:hypothetical protein